jgi:hypothetical protein
MFVKIKVCDDLETAIKSAMEVHSDCNAFADTDMPRIFLLHVHKISLKKPLPKRMVDVIKDDGFV